MNSINSQSSFRSMIWSAHKNTTQYVLRRFSSVNLITLNVFMRPFLCLSTGTQTTSCDSCHAEAFCLDQKERGDTFSGHAHPYTCLCKDGFVGDGLTCYDAKLCSDSSCCSPGYHWSPERGCVDVDECSLPDSPCNSRQICKNTPGSVECLESVPKLSSGPSSKSFRIVCGGKVCPTGMDCILHNGTSRCADPCYDYTVLNDEWRSTNFTGDEIHCDRDINWQGWYRMLQGQTSARIPESCPEPFRCGTHAPLYLVEPHPTQSGVIVDRTVCKSWQGCCSLSTYQIHVKRCYGGYYVYKLIKPNGCSFVYCSGNAPMKSSSLKFAQTNLTHVTYLNNIFFYSAQNPSFSVPHRVPISSFTDIIYDSSVTSETVKIFFSAFNDTFPPGSVTLPVGSPLYVGVSVENRGPDFAVVLEDCFASHSRSPQSPVKYPLIQNRCPVDPRQVEVIENGRSTRARFSALFFLPNGKHEDVYLHCNLTLCDRRKYKGKPTCPDRTRHAGYVMDTQGKWRGGHILGTPVLRGQ
uniref:ZP domain-containing protein n=1 Tax=Salarias fasciatus TaxID=181472 RepID=A0A672HDK1_SALFA